MTDLFAFALTALALLAIPGPTNVLLAAAGASASPVRALPLVGGAIAGYLISITLLGFVVRPLAQGAPVVDVGLRIACGVYLLYTAWNLWRKAPTPWNSTIGIRRVFIATALNPKIFVFAFAIIPLSINGGLSIAHLALLVVLIGVVSTIWLGLGVAIQARALIDGPMVRNASALLLCVFGVLISGSALAP